MTESLIQPAVDLGGNLIKQSVEKIKEVAIMMKIVRKDWRVVLTTALGLVGLRMTAAMKVYFLKRSALRNGSVLL